MKKFLMTLAVLACTVSPAFAQSAPAAADAKTAPAAGDTAPPSPEMKTPPAVENKANPAPVPATATPSSSATSAAIAAGMAQPDGATTIVRGGNVIVLPRHGNCGEKRETASLDINFMYAEENVSDLSKEIDGKAADVKTAATKAGATSVDMTEMNYNVTSNRNMGYNNGDSDANAKYHINGRMHFNITPADKAAALLETLSANKELHPTLNYQMNTGFCPPGVIQ